MVPDKLTAICEPIVQKNVGASTSHNPAGLHRRYRDSSLPRSEAYVSIPEVRTVADVKITVFWDMKLYTFWYIYYVSELPAVYSL
jgi:hypothetical protein